jgi:hypothetical protein
LFAEAAWDLVAELALGLAAGDAESAHVGGGTVDALESVSGLDVGSLADGVGSGRGAYGLADVAELLALGGFPNAGHGWAAHGVSEALSTKADGADFDFCAGVLDAVAGVGCRVVSGAAVEVFGCALYALVVGASWGACLEADVVAFDVCALVGGRSRVAGLAGVVLSAVREARVLAVGVLVALDARVCAGLTEWSRGVFAGAR